MRYTANVRNGMLPILFALAGCHARQPTVEATNTTTNAKLDDIAAHTNASDGMDQGNAALLAAPSVGQQMAATPGPKNQ